MARATWSLTPTRAFVEFYLELLRQRRRILTGDWTPPPEAAPTAGDTRTPADDPRQILSAALEQQRKAVGGSRAAADLRQAQYAMAVLADEVMLGFEWPGREAWSASTLERELFDSTDGDNELYRRIDRLLNEPPAAEAELAQVYLLTLAVGFRGRFQGEQETTHIDAYRADLARWLAGGRTEEPSGQSLIPQPYGQTRDQGRYVRLPSLREWRLLLVGVVVLLLLASQALWRDATSDLEELVERTLRVD